MVFFNIKYGSYPQNSDVDDLYIEYKQILFTQQTIDSLKESKL